MMQLDQIERVGAGLNRPECVLATRNGRIYTADWRGGVAVTEANGESWLWTPKAQDTDLKANGIALMPDNSVLLAHLGDEEGGIYQITEDRDLIPFCMEVAGKRLPPSNYVHLDAAGRIWVTVSTRQIPRALGYSSDVADGFILLIDKGTARIVAEGLGYTNECVVHPDGERLFVNETFARRLSSFDILPNGDLENRQTVAEFGHGVFPDGLIFDKDGGIWITSIVSNRVIRLTEGGAQNVIIEDYDPEHLNWVEQAFLKGEMGRPRLDKTPSKMLKNISSLAFGG
ncbi:MAG: SMP-30/gluconolactonase/LRE family protein, partial [Sneathiellales bacterium]|nr:SMP-30/gluconolactonase/LRE family protein [Sneathiellales bacterium]